MEPTRLQTAERAFEAGDLDQAGRLCSELVQVSPNNAAAIMLQGMIATRRGQTAEGVSLLKRALDLSPNDYTGLTWLQVALRAESKFQQAIEAGERSHTLWPTDAQVLLNLSWNYLGARDLGKAVDCLTRAAELQPENPAIHNQLGVVYAQLEQVDSAAAAFQRAIALAPNVEKGYVQLGKLWMANGKFQSVVELCRSALSILPRSAETHLLYAKALSATGDETRAVEHAETAASINPELRANVGLWFLDNGKFDDAARYFRKSIEHRPVQGFAYFGLVQSHKVTESDRDLIDQMASLIGRPELSPREESSLRYGLGKAADDLREYEKAMRYFDEGNKLNHEVYRSEKSYDPEEQQAYLKAIASFITADFIEERQELGSNSDVPIFVIGMIRSGTTLLEQILSSHRDVGSSGEQRFWLVEAPQIVSFSAGKLDASKFIEARDRYLEILRAFQPDSARVTDKMPFNFHWAGLIHLAYPKSPIIHIQRHPVDNALSIWMTELATPPQFAHDKKNIIAAYRDYQRMMRHWRKVIPGSTLLEVRYEDLTGDQEAWTRLILEHCKLEWDPACLNFHTNSRQVSTPSRWQVRQPMYRSSVEKWRNYEPWLGEFAELLTDAT